MPREPIPLIRKGGYVDAEKMYVLSFEGSLTEKKYFEDFRNSYLFNNNGLIETIPLKRPKNKGTDPFSVTKILLEAKKEFRFKPTDEFWLIFDRDDWEPSHNLSFDQLVIQCRKEKNFYLAMSNPCFEIWLVLHLKDISEYSEEELIKIYQNEKVSKNKNYIAELLGSLQVTGQGFNKTPNPQIYLPLTFLALERAKALDDSTLDYPKQVGTHVYKLIEKIIIEKENHI